RRFRRSARLCQVEVEQAWLEAEAPSPRLRLRVLPSAILVGCRAFPRSLVVFALVFFPCFCRLLRRLAAVLSRAARARLAAELLPVLLGHVHAVMLRRFLDVGEGELA